MKNTSAALPEGWSEATLGDLLIRIVGGGTPPRNVAAYFEGTIPWFTVKDMKSPRPEDAQEHISDEAVRCSATNLIEPDTLVIATRIALGKAIMPTVRCTINQDLKALYFGGDVSPKFMLYWVMASEQLIQSRGSGTTVMGIRLEHVKEFSLAVPPANEQTRIVEKLEELLSDLNAGVAELIAAQRKLAQYRQSLLKAAVEGTLTADWRAARKQTNKPQETGAELLQRILTERRARWEAKQLAKFTDKGKTPPKSWKDKYKEPVEPDTHDLPTLPDAWVWSTLEQLTEFITSGSRGWGAYYADEGATFIRSQNINKDSLDLADIAYVTPPRNSEGARTRVASGDLLLTITGANVGKAAWVDIELAEAYVSQHVALIRPVETALCSYLHLYLTTVAGGRGQLNEHAYGAGKPGLNLQQVAAVHVPIPSAIELVRLMEETTTQLDETMTQHDVINHALKQSAAQRKNILRAAFAGQLVPQDPNDEPASVLLDRIRAERAAHGSTGAKRGRTPRKTA